MKAASYNRSLYGLTHPPELELLSLKAHCCDASQGSSCSLKAIRKANIRSDRPGVVGHGVEKKPWLNAGKVECKDDVAHGRPPNLEIWLSAKVARAALTG
jgi:hypothetical protein